MMDGFAGIKVLRPKKGGIEYLKEGDPVWSVLSVLVSSWYGGGAWKCMGGAYYLSLYLKLT